jgi:hypothetical protein
MSLAITFHAALLCLSSARSQASCSGAEVARLVVDRALAVVAVRAAVAAHVDHEHVQQRAVGDAAVDTLVLLLRMPAHRRVLEERACAARGEQRHVLLGVALVGREVLARRPVVRDLVVVPLPDLHHLAAEAAEVRVELVVAMGAAELLQRLRDLALLFGEHAVAPGAAVGELDLGEDRPVGIDGVAAVDEEVGVALAHRLVDLHAAEVVADAPALADRVARPQEAHVARG